MGKTHPLDRPTGSAIDDEVTHYLEGGEASQRDRPRAFQALEGGVRDMAKAKVSIKGPPPAKSPRCVINDATSEKVAEILSRDPAGSLMVHDELAGLLESFERYSSGSSRAFYLSCWNGGPFNKDRIAKGPSDPASEIHVDNLALGILGGIQPDKLAKLRDLTSDGLLQRFLPVLMCSAERGSAYHPVVQAEANYDTLIKKISAAEPADFQFEEDALEVRDRMSDYLHKLEMVDGFSPALIGAIGKLKGYFARICLVLHIAYRNDPLADGEQPWAGFSTEEWSPEKAEHLRKLLGVTLDDNLANGIRTTMGISRRTAEAAEKIVREFLLPNIFATFDVLGNGGRDRDMLRSIADFILAANRDRLRPSDFTAHVRALRGQPDQKIREWAGRFCALGWLQPERKQAGCAAEGVAGFAGAARLFRGSSQAGSDSQGGST